MDPIKDTSSRDRQTCPSLFGHGVTWLILICILAISAWASTLYLMPLVEKAHVVADDAYVLLGKANDKFAVVDLIEEQVQDIDKLMPAIETTVAHIDSTARNIDSNVDALVPRLGNAVEGIDAQVHAVKAIANRTSALVDGAALVLAAILDTAVRANATLGEVQAQARALDAMLREANQTLQDIRAAQRALPGA